MARDRQLRVYYGPDDAKSVPLKQVSGSETVEISLNELLITLGDAVEHDRSWPDDFGNEKIMISTDLYETMAAYRHLRRSA